METENLGAPVLVPCFIIQTAPVNFLGRDTNILEAITNGVLQQKPGLEYFMTPRG